MLANASTPAAPFIEGPSPRAAHQAWTIVADAAVDRYERARETFEAIEAVIALAGPDDATLDFYAHAACNEMGDAEAALLDALLARQHERELSATPGYHLVAHHAEHLACGGKLYRAVGDPDQDLAIGERGVTGPAMRLVVREGPMALGGRYSPGGFGREAG